MDKFEALSHRRILKSIFDHSYNMIVITDANLDLPGPEFLYVNKAFEQKTGYTFDELKGQTPRILQGELSDKEVLATLKSDLQAGRDFSGATTNYTKEGTPYFVEWCISPIKDDAGKTIQYVAIQNDLTSLHEGYKLTQSILDKVSDIVIVSDGLEVTFANQRFLDFFDCQSLEEFLSQYNCICEKFMHIDGFYYQKTDDEDWIKAITQLPKDKRVVSLIDSHYLPHAFQVEIQSYGQNKYIVSFSDITNVYSEKEKYKKEALYDELTKARSRAYLMQFFQTHLHDTLRRNKQLCMMILDIDYFKKINDSYGHNTGDAILKQLVQLIKQNIRIDDRVIRWGGEEFIILVCVANLDMLQKIAQNLRRTIEEYRFDVVKKLTCSFGIAAVDPKLSLEDNVEKVDQALYRAKKSGRNRVEFA